MYKKILLIIIPVILILVIFFLKIGRHPTSTVSPNTGTYIALGDSVSSGVGLQDDSDSSACNRTNQSYPNLIAKDLHYQLVNSSCSGATILNGILGSQDVNELQETPQIAALYAHPKPSLITITIGANDAGWTNTIAACYRQKCGSAADTIKVANDLSVVGINLQKILDGIKTHYNNNPPQVIVTGYHQVFPQNTDTNCSDLHNIDSSELAWLREQQTKLNETIQSAAQNSDFAIFAPVDFSGHELCTTVPWVQGLADTDPYHPTAQGQTVFANAILHTIKNK